MTQAAELTIPLSPTLALDVMHAAAHADRLAARIAGSVAIEGAARMVGSVAVITIDGTLAQRGWSWRGITILDGYDLIEARFDQALASGAEAILAVVDSPGGDAAGAFEGFRRIRAKLDASGIPVVSYANELAASGGYLMAALADEILLPAEAEVGSIGVIAAHADLTEMFRRAGIKTTVIRDPEGKAVPNSLEPLNEEGSRRLQDRVSELAATFNAIIAKRRSMSPAAVKELNAGVFSGKKAVAAGLADGIASYEQAIARAAQLGRKKRKERMASASVLALLGMKEGSLDEEVEERAKAAAPILALGRHALAITGSASTDEAKGTLSAWKTSHTELPGERAELAKIKGEQAQAERLQICETLVREGKATPAEVWIGGDKAKGIAPFFASVSGHGDDQTGMSLGQLRAYQKAATTKLTPILTKHAPSGANFSAEQVKAFAKANNLPEGMEWLAEAELKGRAENGTNP